MILGIDEVGRGPWAGPLVVGAVVLPDGISVPGLTDSKKLTAKKRAQLDVLIREAALGWGLGWVHAQELDEVGLGTALRLATVRAVEAVKVPYHEIIIDGTINFLSTTTKGAYVTTLPKADALIPAVSAASIIAKVARDTYMEEQARAYPGYGFESHVGYGTAQHRRALETSGITPEHRRSFRPIAVLAGSTPRVAPEKQHHQRTAKQSGDLFETAVAQMLTQQGYSIIERNWKTRYCEIDIIASHAGTTYFIEAKYRRTTAQGGGAEAIDATKRAKMRRAAEVYAATHAGIGEYCLMAAVSHPANPKEVECMVLTDE